ncbi:MAG TPA: hypothetical protein VFO18_01445 [Methylomirabilota bacterium]|nr:hypothetical protein [Methylomirabilota bacterium]
MTGAAQALRGIGLAVKSRWKIFAAVALAIFLLDVFLPPLVLSVARKPMTSFTLNPWLKNLPDFVASAKVPLSRKIEFLPQLALFWFVSAGSIEPEWGFAVTVTDLFRFIVMALLFGAYFALWVYRRDTVAAHGWGLRRSKQGGVVGAFVTTLGLSTGPCTVTGCGAPVLPVLGLAFAGLSSGTIKWMSELSTLAATAVLAGAAAAVLYLGWQVGRAAARR